MAHNRKVIAGDAAKLVLIFFYRLGVFDESDMSRNSPRFASSGLSGLSDYLFGYDVFISYAWKDWTGAEWSLGDAPPHYPSALAQRLRSEPYNYKVFLDQDEFSGGVDLKEATKRRVCSSRVLVLLLRPQALNRRYVLSEVQACITSRRTPFVLDFNGTFDGADDSNLLREELSNEQRDFRRIPVSLEALDGHPDDATIHELVRYFDFTRTETTRLRWVTGAVVALLLLSMGLAIGIYNLVLQRNRANRLRMVSVAQALSAHAPHQREELEQDERAALLARQAFIFHEAHGGNDIAQMDRSLRRVLEPDYFSFILPGLGNGFVCVCFSPQGRWLVGAANDQQHNLQLWDMRKKAAGAFPLVGHSEGVTAIAFSPDETLLASGGFDGKVRLWDIGKLDGKQRTAKCRILPGLDEGVTSISFSADGTRLAAAGEEKEGKLWDVSQLDRPPMQLTPPAGELRAVCFSPTEGQLAGGCDDGTVVIWNLLRNDRPVALKTNREEVTRPDRMDVSELQFTANGRWLVSSDLSSIRLWDLSETAKPVVIRANGGDREEHIAVTPDGRWLAAGSDEIELWDLGGKVPERVVIADNGSTNHKLVQWINEVAFSFDSRWLAVARADGTVRLWDVDAPGDHPQVLQRGRDDGASSIAFSPDQNWIAAGMTDGNLRVWSLRPSRAKPIRLTAGENEVTSLAFSPDGRWLLAGGDLLSMFGYKNEEFRDVNIEVPPHPQNGTRHGDAVAFGPTKGRFVAGGDMLRLSSVEAPAFDVQTWAPILKQDRIRQPIWVYDVAFSPQGDWLAVALDFGTVRILDSANPENELANWVAHESAAREVAVSPDASWIITVGNGTAKWWKRKPGDRLEFSLHKQEQGLCRPIHSADGEWLAFGRKSFLTLSSPDGRKMTDLSGHARDITSVDFARDGKRVASSSDDGSVRIWSLVDLTAQPVVLAGGGEELKSVAFSPDGNLVAAGNEDGLIYVWIATPAVLADMACQMVRRDLTLEEWAQFVGRDIPYVPVCPDVSSQLSR